MCVNRNSFCHLQLTQLSCNRILLVILQMFRTKTPPNIAGIITRIFNLQLEYQYMWLVKLQDHLEQNFQFPKHQQIRTRKQLKLETFCKETRTTQDQLSSYQVRAPCITKKDECKQLIAIEYLRISLHCLRHSTMSEDEHFQHEERSSAYPNIQILHEMFEQ